MSNLQWLLLISLICGCFVFIFWVIMTIVEAKQLAKEEYDPFYEPTACTRCGNFTIWLKSGVRYCDACGMEE